MRQAYNYWQDQPDKRHLRQGEKGRGRGWKSGGWAAALNVSPSLDGTDLCRRRRRCRLARRPGPVYFHCRDRGNPGIRPFESSVPAPARTSRLSRVSRDCTLDRESDVRTGSCSRLFRKLINHDKNQTEIELPLGRPRNSCPVFCRFSVYRCTVFYLSRREGHNPPPSNHVMRGLVASCNRSQHRARLSQGSPCVGACAAVWVSTPNCGGAGERHFPRAR